MEWRTLPPPYNDYEVSDTGIVKSKKQDIILGRNFVGRGYKTGRSNLAVTLYSAGRSRKHYVHALVAVAFLPPKPPGYTINHKNGRKQDNRAENLEWVSMRENIRHSYRTGLIKRKLSYKLALEIRERAHAGILTQTEIAHFYDVSPNTVGKIKAGKMYQPWTDKH